MNLKRLTIQPHDPHPLQDEAAASTRIPDEPPLQPWWRSRHATEAEPLPYVPQSPAQREQDRRAAR